MTARTLLAALPFALCALAASAADPQGVVIDSMDEPRFGDPTEKGRSELVDGKDGKAARFDFDAGSVSTFFTSNIRGTPEWDEADGISFWVKGDGSEHFGGLQFIWNDDYAVRYDVMFPITSTEWTKITVAWRDLVPVLPGPNCKPLDPSGENANKPSQLSAMWFGKWWYWRDYPAHSFAVDDIRLEADIPADDEQDEKPEGHPLRRVLDKLKAGEPVTIVTMGDSLTDVRHWANREVSWPVLIEQALREKYKSEITIHNAAVGGNQLRQGVILMPRWLAKAPEPDLVTICFGYNDWDAGMRGEEFRAAYEDAVDRVRRATRGKAEVLILTTLPSVERWTTMHELADACRAAAGSRNAGLADTEQAFLTAGEQDKERLYSSDQAHLGPAGHEVMAETVLQAIESAGDE